MAAGVPNPGNGVEEARQATRLALDYAKHMLNVSTGDFPVLFQREHEGPYEEAQPGEVLYWQGERIRFAPAHTPFKALVLVSWLENSFGTYGSATTFTFTTYNGSRYALLDAAEILSGQSDAFSAVILGQSGFYTAGHTDMVAMADRGMKITFQQYPATVSTKRTRLNTTSVDTASYHQDRLAINFVSINSDAQDVLLNKSWLNGLGLTHPRFVHEDGFSIPFNETATHYIVHAPHFSTLYVENFNDGAANGWYLSGLWHVTSSACTSAYSSYYLAYSQDSTCNYNTGATTAGEASFNVDLTGASTPYLNFYEKHSVESYSPPYDIMRVQVSTNSGQSWSTLAQWDSTMSAQTSWAYRSYSLSPYAGGVAKIRFYFDSVDSLYNNFPGWFIDNVEVTGTASSNQPPSAYFTVSPSSGTTSTTFNFDASGSSDDQTPTSSLEVRWDWNGDGTYDTSWTTTKTVSHQYTAAGTYTIWVQVKDTSGASGTTYRTLTVTNPTNNPPVAAFTVNPTSGTTSTTFSFDASASSDDQTASSSLQVRWDWNNDGAYDTSWTTVKTAQHQFTSAGTYTVRLQVMDGNSQTGTTTKSVPVSTPNNPPTAYFTANPWSGDTSTNFLFDASGSYDDQTPSSSLQVRWDWNNDGTYDTAWTTTKTVYHQFGSPGTKTVRLQVMDGGGLTGTTTNSVSVADNSQSTGTGLTTGFESASGWEFGGLWHQSTKHITGGTYAARYGRSCCNDYNTGATNTGTLTSPKFTVPSTNPVLTFWSWHVTEGGTYYDKMLVQILPTGGSWQSLGQVADNMQVWNLEKFKLDSFKNQEVRIRFVFDTVDGIYNDYEGWYVDTVEVATDIANKIFTTEWTHSTVETTKTWDSYHYTSSPEGYYPVNDKTDNVQQRFDIQSGGNKGTVWLSVYARASGCSNGGSYSHQFLANGKLVGSFNPCYYWSTSDFSWVYFTVPLASLNKGMNSFSIRGVCNSPCDPQLQLMADTDPPGFYSTITMNGGCCWAGEMYWNLLVEDHTPTESLERYMTVQSTNQETGQLEYEHVQETDVYIDPSKLNLIHTMYRELPNGQQTYAGTTIQFQKRSYYNDQTKIPGWQHWTYDMHQNLNSNQGKLAPVQNTQFYTWFKAEWSGVTFKADGTPQHFSGHEMRLVPSNPSNPQDKNSDGGQRPPANAGSSDGSNFKFNFEVVAGYDQCGNPQGEHWLDVFPSTGAPSGTHWHDCLRIALHVFELNKDIAKFADAPAMMQGINDWLTTVFDKPGGNIAKWAKASIKIGFQGPGISWFYSLVQSGDAFHFEVEEKDHGGDFFGLAFTVVSIVPPFVGWALPVDPQLPGHWMPTMKWGDSLTKSN